MTAAHACVRARRTRDPFRVRIIPVALCVTVALFSLALASAAQAEQKSLVVKASAYNSLVGQTRGKPNVGAWGDELVPGMKAIAVSRDLLKRGLTHNVRVTIDGLPGEYVVLDKMNKRWKQKIDIYMGEDRESALAWGVRRVTIRWSPPKR